MRNINHLQRYSKLQMLKQNNSLAKEPMSMQDATRHAIWILDAKYDKADLPAIVRESCSHLSATDREMLLSLLLRYESLFNGTLGDWNLPPVSFELKEDMKPYHGKAYPIPHIHKATLVKKIERLCEIGVLTWQPASKWAAPSFTILHTISNFRELNKCIVWRSYPIPKISTTL